MRCCFWFYESNIASYQPDPLMVLARYLPHYHVPHSSASPLWLRNLWPQCEGGRTRGGNASSLVFPSLMPFPLPTELPHFCLSIVPAPLQLCLDLGIGNQAHRSQEESTFARIVVPGQCRHSRDFPESRQLIHDQERGIYPCRGQRTLSVSGGAPVDGMHV